jgi:hypothetical protein
VTVAASMLDVAVLASELDEAETSQGQAFPR